MKKKGKVQNYVKCKVVATVTTHKTDIPDRGMVCTTTVEMKIMLMIVM